MNNQNLNILHWVKLLNAFSTTKKVSKALENESDYNYDPKYAFYEFYKGFKKFKRISFVFKYDEIKDFYTLLNAFISTHKATTDETKDRKNRILSYVKPLYNDYLDAYKNFGNKKLTDKDKRKYDYERFEMIDKNKQKLEQTEEEIKREMQKPLWFKINKKEFDELTGSIYNNQDHNDLKFTINEKPYDLKNAKMFWTEVTNVKLLKMRQKNCISNLYKKTLIH